MANKRTDILNAMVTRFQGISSGSYNTDLGDNVFLWRTVPLEETELPALIIRDPRDNIVDLTQQSSNMPALHQMSVELEIVVSDSKASIATLRKCLEDVEAAIKVDETFGGLVMRVQPISNEFLLNQEGDTVAGCLYNLRVDFRTVKFSAN